MKKLRHTICSLALTAIAVLIFTQCAAGQRTGTGATVIRDPGPAWQGIASGIAQPFKPKQEALKTTLLTHPVPEMWLLFVEPLSKGQSSRTASKGPLIKVQLPPDAKSILKSYWEEALAFEYYEAFEKRKSTAQEGFDRSKAWFNYHQNTLLKLMQIKIDAPNYRRTISEDEATDLLVFAHRAAIDLMKKARVYQQERANTF